MWLMEDISPLVNEMRLLNQEWLAAQAASEANDARIDNIKKRRQLLDETWKTLWGHEEMTLIQAKMIAHENVAEKKVRHYFDWATNDDVDFRQSRWTRMLRATYRFLGGK